MACEICGRNSCTRSFHALDEQNNFDVVANNVKERMKDVLKRQIERLTDYGNDENRNLVDLSEVLDVIDSYS
jgi:hypothetical protein